MDITTLALAKAYTDKQRLAYIEDTGVFCEGELTFNGEISVFEGGISSDLTVGEEYTIVLDSGSYTGICKAIEFVKYVGNGGLVDATDDTGEPFVFATMPGADLNGFFVLDLNCGTHFTIKEQKIHKIEPKYLPSIVMPIVEIADLTTLTKEEKAVLNTCNGPIWLKTQGAIAMMNYQTGTDELGNVNTFFSCVFPGDNSFTLFGTNGEWMAIQT